MKKIKLLLLCSALMILSSCSSSEDAAFSILTPPYIHCHAPIGVDIAPPWFVLAFKLQNKTNENMIITDIEFYAETKEETVEESDSDTPAALGQKLNVSVQEFFQQTDGKFLLSRPSTTPSPQRLSFFQQAGDESVYALDVEPGSSVATVDDNDEVRPLYVSGLPAVQNGDVLAITVVIKGWYGTQKVQSRNLYLQYSAVTQAVSACSL